MSSYPPGFGPYQRPTPRSRARANREVDRALRTPEPQQPGETEHVWIGTALLVVAGLLWIDYLLVGALTTAYLTGMMVVVIGVTLLVPGNVPAKVARVIGVSILVVLILLLAASGLPLATMEALSPTAQNLQDNENGINNDGNSVNFLFMLVISILTLVLFIWTWVAKNPWKIILLSVLTIVPLFFFIGIAGQAAISDM